MIVQQDRTRIGRFVDASKPVVFLAIPLAVIAIWLSA